MPLPRVFGTEHELVINIPRGDMDYLDKLEAETILAIKLLEHLYCLFYPKPSGGGPLSRNFFSGEQLTLFPEAELNTSDKLQASDAKRILNCRAWRVYQEAGELIGSQFNCGFMTPLGSRYYIDHGYFEYSGAEFDDPFVYLAAQIAEEEFIAGEFEKLFGDNSLRPRLYKNVSDGRRHSQAAHRNFCISADLWPRLVSRDAWGNFHFLRNHTTRETKLLATWHVVEQLFGGAGKYGEELAPWPKDIPKEEIAKLMNVFQISGRADFTEKILGEETTQLRPIINQRYEPLADETKYGRYHCICGDANRAEWPHLFKMGLTAIFLGMLEDDAHGIDFYVADPVSAIKAVSRDATCQTPICVTTFGGRDFALTPLQIMEVILAEMIRYVSSRSVPAWCEKILDKALWAAWAFRHNPKLLERVLDWKIKEWLGHTERGRKNSFLRHIEYHALSGPTYLYRKLCENEVIETVIPRWMIDKYKKEPPETTRAYFRGNFLKRFYEKIDFVATDWCEIVFRWLGASGVIPRKIQMLEPLQLTKKDWGVIFERAGVTLEPFKNLIVNITGFDITDFGFGKGGDYDRT